MLSTWYFVEKSFQFLHLLNQYPNYFSVIGDCTVRNFKLRWLDGQIQNFFTIIKSVTNISKFETQTYYLYISNLTSVTDIDVGLKDYGTTTFPNQILKKWNLLWAVSFRFWFRFRFSFCSLSIYFSNEFSSSLPTSTTRPAGVILIPLVICASRTFGPGTSRISGHPGSKTTQTSQPGMRWGPIRTRTPRIPMSGNRIFYTHIWKCDFCSSQTKKRLPLREFCIIEIKKSEKCPIRLCLVYPFLLLSC